MIPAWLIRGAPYIGAIIVAGLIYAKGRDDGWTARDNKGLRDQIVAERDVAKREGELQRQIDAGAFELSRLTAQLGQQRQADDTKRSNFYVKNPVAAAAVCLPDGRYVHHRDADARAQAALATGRSDAAMQPDPGAVPDGALH